MKMLDTVKKEERGDKARDWYAVDPKITYPAAIAFIKRVRAGTITTPKFLVDTLIRISAVETEYFALALKPASECPVDLRPIRGKALEAARIVFTAMMRKENGRPIGVHILKNEDWRL